MILHQWGLLPYEIAYKQMCKTHQQALEDGQNHLILVEHPACYTIGQDNKELNWDVETISTDRGGSITCHSEGQNVYYFCFQTPSPPRFFKNIKEVFSHFFEQFELGFYYDNQNPGFYIQNRKICSLGFRYKEGVSLHGVALNVSVDLAFHNRIHPCGLENISATSLKHEDIHISCEEVNNFIISEILKIFDESL